MGRRKRNYVLCCAKLLQSCPTVCNHLGCSPPGSSVHGILQARVLEWVAVSFFRGSSLPRDGTQVSYWQLGSLPLAPPGKPEETMGVIKKSWDQKVFGIEAFRFLSPDGTWSPELQHLTACLSVCNRCLKSNMSQVELLMFRPKFFLLFSLLTKYQLLVPKT